MSSLQNRKLKIFSANPGRLTVTVFQDGSAADGDATSGYRFDNAFREGAQSPGTTSRDMRVDVILGTLSHDPDNGRSFSFRLKGAGQWAYNQYPAISVQPNDRVKFYADAPTNNAAVATPAWHLNNQAGQVLIFDGWVDDFRSTGSEEVTVTCRDAFWRANDVRLKRDTTNGVEVPKIAFNLDPSSADFVFSYHRLTPSTTGIGSPTNMADRRMTVREILLKLEEEYAAELQAIGVIPGSSIFESGDLAGLTHKPGPIVLEDVGWTDALRQILGSWAPDMRMVIDPRTSKWRIVRAFGALKPTSTTLKLNTYSERVLSGGAYRTRIQVANPAVLSATPGTDGYTLRLQSTYDPQRSYVATVRSIAGDVVVLNEDLGAENTFFYPDIVLPAEADVLPTLSIDHDNVVDPSSLEMSVDLRDVYSRVVITSTQQMTEQHRATWIPGVTQPDTPNSIYPGWDQTFEQIWRNADEDREGDAGRDEGVGMRVWAIVEGTGVVDLYIPYAQSAHGNDHTPNEWVGASIWVISSGGVNWRGQNATFRITENQHEDDVGNGDPGLRIRIATSDWSTPTGGAFLAGESVGLDDADRVQIQASFSYPATTDVNRRWEIGRKFVFTTQNLKTDSSTHVQTCTLPQFTIHDGTGRSRVELGLNPNLTNPPNNTQPQGAWERLDLGGIGSHGIFRRAFYTQRVAKSQSGPSPWCDRVGYTPPKAVEATWETTTNTFRQAQYPPGGAYDGLAYRTYGIQRTKTYPARSWISDDQQADYEALAERLWRAHQRVNHRGSVTVYGALEHLAWFDLGIRAAYYHRLFPAGAGGILSQFWSVVIGVNVDLENDSVQFNFDPDSGLRKLDIETFEDLAIREVSKTNALEDEMRRIRDMVQCLAGARPAATSPGQCDSSIAHGPRNTNVSVKVERKNNLANGMGETSIANGSGGGARPSTHGGLARETVIRDAAGNYFLVSEGGSIVPGTVTGSEFAATPSATTTPVTTQSQASEAAAAALAAVLGLTPVVTPPPIFSELLATGEDGEGRTVFTVKHTGLTAGQLDGGEIHVLDFDPDNVRAGYPILATGTSTVSVARITEANPGYQTPVILWHPRAPRPTPVDPWPAGGLLVKDRDGGYAVVECGTGKLHAVKVDFVARTITADAAGKVKLGLGPEVGTGSVVYDTTKGFAGEVASETIGKGAGQVGYSDPLGLTAARDVEEALTTIFRHLYNNPADPFFETTAVGGLDFSDTIQTGHLVTIGG